MRWNFGDSRRTSLSLDEFLAQKEADGVEFFAGKEPWLVQILKHIHKVRGSSTFFRGRLDFSLKEYGPQHLATLRPQIHSSRGGQTAGGPRLPVTKEIMMKITAMTSST